MCIKRPRPLTGSIYHYRIMLTWFTSALRSVFDIILPLRDRAARTRARNVSDLPIFPTSYDLLGQRITTLMNYRDPAAEDLIRSLKYDQSGFAAALAAEALADFLREEIASIRAFSSRPILIVPVPLHKNRLRERGFNQIERVLEKLPADFKDGTLIRYAPNLLVRTRETTPQTKLSRSERLTNVEDAFSLADATAIRNAHIIVVDDVTTTGATLAAVAKPLSDAKASVLLLALAHAQRFRR